MKIRPQYLSRFTSSFLRMGLLGLLLSLAACSSPPTLQQYDFGPIQQSKSETDKGKLRGQNILLPEIRVPLQFDGQAMWYRLNYENGQELRAYAQNRWSAPPAHLLAQSVKRALHAEGGRIVNPGDGVSDLPQLRLELEEFAQHFASPSQSQAALNLRATMVHKNRLLAQQHFSIHVPAASADARGGAAAMAIASQQLNQQLIDWLQAQTPSAKMP